MIILYFHLPYFHVWNIDFFYSTLVLSFYIDVVLALSIRGIKQNMVRWIMSLLLWDMSLLLCGCDQYLIKPGINKEVPRCMLLVHNNDWSNISYYKCFVKIDRLRNVRFIYRLNKNGSGNGVLSEGYCNTNSLPYWPNKDKQCRNNTEKICFTIFRSHVYSLLLITMTSA